MAVKKKTVDEIAKEYAIDMSEEAAKKMADAYIRPELDKIDEAEQKVITDTQAARKTLDNNYFNQYRANTYEAQSRGLTGGLAQMDNQQLRMQLGQANADLSKNLIQTQYNAGLQRGTALANAEAYKTDYLNKIRAQVAELQQADYNQRYQAYIDNENLLLKKQQLQEEADRWEKNYELNKQQFELDKTAAEIQNEAYRRELLNSILPDVMRTYQSYLNNDDIAGAFNYADSQNLDKYGYSVQQLARDAAAINQVQNYQTKVDEYTKAVKAARLKAGAGYAGGIASGGLAAVLAANPFSLPFTIPLGWAMGAGTGAGSLFGISAESSTNELKKYQRLLAEAQDNLSKATLPTWYQNYLMGLGQ